MQSDAELVRAVTQGHRDAFAELVNRYQNAVRAVAAGILGDLHEADDVAQEAFISAYTKLDSLRAPERFGPWLLKIARRKALSQVRRRPDGPSLENPADIPAPNSNGRLSEESHVLLAAVMALPRHERNVIMLRHFQGHAVSDIARITGRSTSTVTKQLSRAYARLRHKCEVLKP